MSAAVNMSQLAGGGAADVGVCPLLMHIVAEQPKSPFNALATFKYIGFVPLAALVQLLHWNAAGGCQQFRLVGVVKRWPGPVGLNPQRCPMQRDATMVQKL